VGPRPAGPGAIIVGSGIAGLTAALELGNCTVVTRSELGAGASRWAQGGIAAAIAPDDSPAAHAADTRSVSGGLTVDRIVDLVTAAAPERIHWLRELGTTLDVDGDGRLALGREAGHGHRRIVHAGGDATGAAVMQALTAAVRTRPDIVLLEHRHAIDLVRSSGRIVGVIVVDPEGRCDTVLGGSVVLATGGIGRVYARTTNPPEATGDGLAMALRAGAAIRDPEFVQFHPTALDTASDPTPLLTEALRGEGAHLIDDAGNRYLPALHPAAELAPRDVVARANWRQQQRGPIYLDVRPIGPDLTTRFPTVVAACHAAGIDPRDEPIPTTPVQHYHVGGISTDAEGRTTLPGLFACGEAASVGLHGANRLASNSLVEGLVMGARVAAAIRHDPPARGRPARLEAPTDAISVRADTTADDGDAIAHLRRLMWDHGGVNRHEDGLRTALDDVADLRPAVVHHLTSRNLLTVAETVLRAALQRRESRGAHFREDHPDPDPAGAQHTVIQRPAVPHRTLTPPAQELAS